MLVYYKGKGFWLDFPIVDSPERHNAKKQWNKDNPTPKGMWDENPSDWEKYLSDREEWNNSNPLPKYTVIENEIFLEREVTDLFGSSIEYSEPILHYQPEEAFVQGVFKLKESDALTLRYEKKVTTQILLPCNHIDSCHGGFFFSPDKPVTLDNESIVSDERDKNEDKDKTIHKNTRLPINERRDADFIKWQKDESPNPGDMIKKELQQVLSDRRKQINPDGKDDLWSSGFEDWVQKTTLYSGRRGRKKGR